MLTVKVIKDFEYVERPVVQRILQDAKCYAEVLKNPIGPQTKLKFFGFNQPRDYTIEKIYELQAISKLEYFTKYGDDYVHFNKSFIQLSLDFKFSTFNALQLINNNAVAVMNLNHDNVYVRFLSNLLITFEIEGVRYL
jgi:hypothetical protein